MTNLNLHMKVQQMIQIHNNDTNQDEFLIEQDGEWVRLTQEEYNTIVRGQK